MFKKGIVMLKSSASAFSANKLCHFFHCMVLSSTVLISTTSSATEWYWTMDGGGVWDEYSIYFSNWADSAGNTPVSGKPLEGDSAFLVLPYQFSFCDDTGYCYLQPVYVQYQDADNPTLESVAIQGGNVLNQWYGLGVDPANTNLTSNYEYIGGSPYTYTPPPGYHIDPSVGFYPQGEHIQNVGINRVNLNLNIGFTPGSIGRYSLQDAADGYFGTLSVGNFEKIGAEGHGEFEQTGGVHIVESALIIGESITGTGSYHMTGGTLDANIENLGVAGYGEFNQTNGTHTVDKQLNIGLNSGGEGVYNLNGGQLTVRGAETIGNSGTGSFIQTGGTHNAGTLTLGTEAGASGSYELNAGTLNVADTLSLDASGVSSFVQNGGVANVGSVSEFGEMSIGGFSGEYTLNDGLLNVIGLSTIRQNGNFTQAGGEFRSTVLTLRGGVTHNMEGGMLNLGQWDVDGYVNQTGGEATVGFTFTVGSTLYLTPTPARRYILEDTGAIPAPSLTVNGTGIIGDQNVGIFTQRGTGSLATFSNLIVGGGSMTFPGYRTGTYELEDGSLVVNGQATIGSTSSGIFNQTGGTNNVKGDMVVGDQANGWYDLQSATLDVNANMNIGRFGDGTVLNSAGYHIIGGDLLLGTEDSGSGEYMLSNLGVLEVRGNEVIGVAGSSTFDHNGGLNWVDHNLTIENASTYSQSDGITHVGEDLIVRALSSYSLSNDAELEVGRNASFNGTLRNDSIFTVGGNLTLGMGELNNNAELTVTGDLDSSSGVFSHLDGDHTVQGNALVNGYNQEGGDFLISGALTSYSHTMTGGRLEADSHLVNGDFEWTGGEHIITGAMEIGSSGDATIGGAVTLTPGSITIIRTGASFGSLTLQGDSAASTAGIIQNQGALTLEGRSTVTAVGGIEGSGRLIVTGAGLKTINADLRNFVNAQTSVSNTLAEFRGSVLNDSHKLLAPAVFSIDNSGVDFYGHVINRVEVDIDPGIPPEEIVQRAELIIRDSLVQFHDDVTNYGTVRITNSEVRGTIYEGGDYSELITDPSDIYFTTMNFSEKATIQAGPGDRFFIEGDFVNGSLENTLWDTDDASLIFNGVGPQNFYLAGIDIGTDQVGYQDNFAWDELIIGTGVDLSFWDGNVFEGAGLYVGALGLEDGVDTGSLLIDYILSDFNIYYDPTRPENDYLQGLTFALNGDGFLMPSAVPVPPAVWLFGSGLLGLVVIARRKKTTV